MYNYIYIYALLCKATRMYPLLCKTRLKLYIYIYMPCFARLCECIPCLAREYYIYICIKIYYIYIYLYDYMYALLCKAVRMYSMLCKEILYIYVCIYIYMSWNERVLKDWGTAELSG